MLTLCRSSHHPAGAGPGGNHIGRNRLLHADPGSRSRRDHVRGRCSHRHNGLAGPPGGAGGRTSCDGLSIHTITAPVSPSFHTYPDTDKHKGDEHSP